jgi:hypothetical protein
MENNIWYKKRQKAEQKFHLKIFWKILIIFILGIDILYEILYNINSLGKLLCMPSSCLIKESGTGGGEFCF